MTEWLGYCLECPDGKYPGSIKILASLRKNVDGKFIVDKDAKDMSEGEIGPSETAFWPQRPGFFPDISGSFVRFQTIPSTEFVGVNWSKDWLNVKHDKHDKWEVQRFGFRIIEEGPDLNWEQEPRWIKGSSKDEAVYIQKSRTCNLVGPWRTCDAFNDESGRRKLEPVPGKPVSEYDIQDIHQNIRIETINGYQKKLLLYELNESKGKPIDVWTTKQLAKWLVEKMVEASDPQIISRFDKEIPGWRKKIKDSIENRSENDRPLFESRWARIESLIGDLEFDAESVEKLLRLPQFLGRVDELVEKQVREKVEKKTGEIEAEVQKKVKHENDELDRIKKESAHEAEKISDLQAELAIREQTLITLQAHLDDSRERLLHDLAIFQSILPGGPPARISIAGETAPAIVEPKALAAAGPLTAVEPAGESISNETAFIDTRLWPSLARWHPGIQRHFSVILHAAVCGSKAVIIPSPEWAKAFTDALGGHARLTIINVEPTWLGFGDLWSGGLGACWDRAHRDSSVIEVVLLRDFNRALPQCYARPLLDLIAGYSDELPVPASGGWPKSLRLFACPASVDEALPLTDEVVQHFTAIEKELPSPGTEHPGQLVEGYVTADTWEMWTKPVLSTGVNPKFVKQFGSLAYSVSGDVAQITRRLETHKFDAFRAKEYARYVRIDYPESYASQQENETGGVR